MTRIDPWAALWRRLAPFSIFGDRPAYLRSPVRVLTVALNPSKREFPQTDPWTRFPRAKGLDPLARAADTDVYLAALDAYFEHKPYMEWFRPSFSDVLAGLGASYQAADGQPNRALHTDLYSPLATDPTWKGLGKALDPASLRGLRETGAALWNDLVATLRPNVVLFSLAEVYLKDVLFGSSFPWPVWKEFRNGRAQDPYLIRMTHLNLGDGHQALAAWGRGRNRPFAITRAEKTTLGRLIGEMINA